jgi:outer membrane protein
VFPIPALSLEYKRWFMQGIRGGYHFVQSDPITANLFTQVRFSGLKPDESPFLEGMDERKLSLDAGLEFIYSGRPVGFRATFLTDTLGRSKGQELILHAMSGIPLGGRGIILAGIGPKWMSQNRVDYFFGVRPHEVRPLLPAFAGRATWNLDTIVTAVINLNPRWSFLALWNRQGFGSGIADSPIVDQSASHTFITSLNYNFR